MAVVNAMGKYVTGLKTFLAVPGNDVPRGSQVDAHIVVGTPGRVEFMIKKRILDTRSMKVFVLDEADVMVGEGGMRDRSVAIKKAIKSKELQILLFSATYADDVRDFAVRMVPKHNIITVK